MRPAPRKSTSDELANTHSILSHLSACPSDSESSSDGGTEETAARVPLPPPVTRRALARERDAPPHPSSSSGIMLLDPTVDLYKLTVILNKCVSLATHTCNG